MYYVRWITCQRKHFFTSWDSIPRSRECMKYETSEKLKFGAKIMYEYMCVLCIMYIMDFLTFSKSAEQVHVNFDFPQEWSAEDIFTVHTRTHMPTTVERKRRKICKALQYTHKQTWIHTPAAKWCYLLEFSHLVFTHWKIVVRKNSIFVFMWYFWHSHCSAGKQRTSHARMHTRTMYNSLYHNNNILL